MRRRDLLIAVLAGELVAGVALQRGGWLSLAPFSPAVPPAPTVVAEPPMPLPSTRVSAVDVRRGDTLVRALQRQGIQRGTSAGIAAALAAPHAGGHLDARRSPDRAALRAEPVARLCGRLRRRWLGGAPCRDATRRARGRRARRGGALALRGGGGGGRRRAARDRPRRDLRVGLRLHRRHAGR